MCTYAYVYDDVTHVYDDVTYVYDDVTVRITLLCSVVYMCTFAYLYILYTYKSA